jgi:hypothetical protein
MLRSIKQLQGTPVLAEDGEIGSLHTVYFDNKIWKIHYLAIDTGGWLSGRKTLVSPLVLNQLGWESDHLRIALHKAQLKDSPELDKVEPLIHLRDDKLLTSEDGPPLDHMGGGLFDENIIGLHPDSIMETIHAKIDVNPPLSEEDDGETLHLRSSAHVIGYYIHAQDGDIGHVEDFLVDDTTWVIHYMVVDTRNWLPGKNVLVSPHWIEQVDWNDSKVYVDLTQEAIENSPEYDPMAPVDRSYEEKLFEYYDRQRYWS